MFSLLKSISKKKVPGQLIIQITDRCNGTCPQCGMRKSENFKRSSISLDKIKEMIDAALEQNIEVVSFTGGEPLLRLNLLIQSIDYANERGMKYIRTGTNGFVFKNPESPRFQDSIKKIVEKLANTALRNFWISIDSADAATHEQMRGLPGVIKGIEKAIPLFHEAGLYPSANLGINRNIAGASCPPTLTGNTVIDESLFLEQFRTAFGSFFSFVQSLGFTMVNTCYPMSIESDLGSEKLSAIYSATASDSIVNFSQQEKALIYKALMDTIPKFRSKLRIFSPRCSLYSLSNFYGKGRKSPFYCRGGIDFFFIDAATQNTYPCGYRGNEDLGTLNRVGLLQQTSVQCDKCDWECFRDPSELFGPLVMLREKPSRLIRHAISEPAFYKAWIEDIGYYFACELFDARKPPNMTKLALYNHQ